jgi:hypothetical protein
MANPHHRHLPTKVEIMQYLEELDKEDQEIEVLKTEPPESNECYSTKQELKEGDIERQIQSVELLLEEYKDNMTVIEQKKKVKPTNKKIKKLQYACEEAILSGTFGGENSRSVVIKTDTNIYLQLPKKIASTDILEGNKVRLKIYRNRSLENDREMDLLTMQKQLLKETANINKHY